LAAAGIAAATPLTEAEVDEALAAHPRIGDRAKGGGAEARFSRVEQAASQDPDAGLELRLRDGNEAYERRFGRVFLIRAAGRSRIEILAELERRMDNDPEAELAETAEQLRQIAALRLRQIWETA
ncbi:2-oxo-4-hydroxy-4-carboxy-5-ureidoimidazoline decarboxylase, partial [uncultured Demequina sp.]|uniref:2-oxo-4-hydroxy-4-carboxy-5-ureidoimidazoline decarboxylase n=1 Tax=uncultured Demequina sp. TaxID=693499 RepID=UPI0025FC7AD7